MVEVKADALEAVVRGDRGGRGRRRGAEGRAGTARRRRSRRERSRRSGRRWTGSSRRRAASFVDQYLRARDRERARDQGDRQLDRRDRRLCGARGDRPGDRRDAGRDLADPGDRQCREGRQRRLSQAGHDRRNAVGLGRATRRRGRRRTRRPSPRSCRRRASSTPIRRRRSRCSTMRCSTSRSGWRSEIATEFARAEGLAFVKGTGTNQPLGFLELAQCGDGGRGAADGHAAVRSAPGVAGGFPGEQPGRTS